MPKNWINMEANCAQCGKSFTRNVPRERFCSAECAYRFRVIVKDGCWEWAGNTNSAGYGLFPWRGKTLAAHRYSWATANERTIEKGMSICHRCDNPPCSNPEHLFLSTHRKNMFDALSKGRMKKPPPHAGEQQWMAKLTEDAVREIRSTPKGYGVATGLARKFGVTRFAIYAVRDGLWWKWVQ